VRYYNHKHIDERQDVWVGAVLMGDFNIAPLNGTRAPTAAGRRYRSEKSFFFIAPSAHRWLGR
jgi:hypothetical protein